jgi:D-glycero-D-manno-heptose 1,7-bisphosphate phosphatase
LIINTIKDLKENLELIKYQNKKVGAISGAFDILHQGHIQTLDHCLKRVDNLFVLVNSDSSVKLYKGKHRPKNNIKKRMKNLENIFPEIFFVSFDEVIPNKILEIIKPDIYYLSEEWSTSPVERLVLDKFGGKVEIHPQLENHSTSKLISSKNMSRGAIFLDRDGTINKDTGYLNNISDIEIPEKNIEGLKAISELDLYIFIVTNQSGIAKNKITMNEFNLVNSKIIEIINAGGGRIDKTYFDVTDANNPSYRRKPNIGMVLEATDEYDVALVNSWMIGDKDSDILLGKYCNMKTIYIKNTAYNYESKLKPDFEVENLMEASVIIKDNLQST